jgi:hypothetical protein
MLPRALLASVTLLASVGLATGLAAGQVIRAGTPAPEVAGERWINSAPLTTPGLRGKVVLVEFWTYG